MLLAALKFAPYLDSDFERYAEELDPIANPRYVLQLFGICFGTSFV